MSELVQQHMESMTEEIEEMRRIKLFSIEETKIILKSCKHYENKINGPTKSLSSFKEYIQFEKNLLRDIQLRRNRQKIAAKKNKIEFKILKRIKYLYEIALQRFTNDFELCLAYFEFCNRSNYHQAASLAVQNMLKTFSHKPQSFQVASGWYLKRDIKQALNTITKGLAIHKECQQLYSEAIRLELLNREKDNWADASRMQDDTLFCSKIETYLQAIFKNIKDCNFVLSLLKTLEKHSFTKRIQDTIIDWLLKNFPNEESVWSSLAERELNGHHSGKIEETSIKSAEFCFNRCIQIYKEGLEKICPAKKTELGTIYLEFLLELEQQSNYSKMVTSELLTSIIQELSKQIQLSEKYYIEWAKRTKDEADATKVIELGLRAIPESVELWKLRLKCEVLKDDIMQFNKVFQRAIKSLKRNSVEMWLMAIRFHSLTSTNEVIEMIYKEAVEQTQEVSNIMKPEYIQWLALSKGIRDARQVYNQYAKKQPYCKGLHMTMAKIASCEIDPDVDEMENIYKLASEQFGFEDSDIWINLIELYLKFKDNFDKKKVELYIADKIVEANTAAEAALANNEMLLMDYKEKYSTLLRTYSG